MEQHQRDGGIDDLSPSGARDRLRAELTREVADLRCRLHEIALRSEALIEAGETAAAAAVMAEQGALLKLFEARVGRRVADAKVELAAEHAAAGTEPPQHVLEPRVIELLDEAPDALG